MIITRTPYRVSFFGGGTDYPEYYREFGGMTLSATIDKYCYITLRRLQAFFEQKYRIVWSRVELPNTVDSIIHPSVRECIRFSGIKDGLDITHSGDLPARSGIGSSSAFTVGLLNALSAYKGEYCGKEKLAKDAIFVEREIIGENVGTQDQTASAHGGFNVITYTGNNITVAPCVVNSAISAELAQNLVLLYTGISRTASEIAKEQIQGINERLDELSKIKEIACRALNVLSAGDCDGFGQLLDQTWQIKRKLTSKVTNSNIDDLYNSALANGALGGKLCGAGGGGFLLFYVPFNRQAQFDEWFRDYIRVRFRFDYNGSSVVYYNNNEER